MIGHKREYEGRASFRDLKLSDILTFGTKVKEEGWKEKKKGGESS